MVGIIHGADAHNWAARSPDDRLRIVAREVSERLAGLSRIFYALAFATMAKGGRGQDNKQEVYFAVALKDLSAALVVARQEVMDSHRAADEQAHVQRVKRRPGKQRKNAA